MPKKQWKNIIGKETIYNTAFKDIGNVVLWDVIKVPSGANLKIKFISKNSPIKQGFRIAIDQGDGYIEINGIKNKSMEIWEGTAPGEFDCKCTTDSGLISIYNIFDERGYTESQTHSSGMLIEKNDTTIIYRCNDHGFDTNFDKLVFSIKICE